jgi:hypothetical protein
MASSVVCASCGAKINPVKDPSICPVCGSGDRQITVHDFAKLDSHETTVSVLSTLHLWIHWTEIAIEQTQAASEARARGLPYKTSTDQSHLFSAALHAEMKASMVAISAAAHAIDAFYGATKEKVRTPSTTTDAWETNKSPRRSRIFEMLKFGCKLGSKTNSWPKECKWLYDARDAAVHYKEIQRDITKHPLHPTGTYTSPELVTYSLEAAERAVKLLFDVLETCLQNPKSQQPQLVAYVTRFKDELARLSEKRTEAAKHLSDEPQP